MPTPLRLPRSYPFFRRNTLSLILGASAVWLTLPIHGAAATTSPLPLAAATLPEMPLHDALLRLGQASGVTLIGDPQLTAGKRSRAVPLGGLLEDTLRQLLHGSGLRAMPNANGEGYRLERSPSPDGSASTMLSAITVTGQSASDVGVLSLNSRAAAKTDTPLIESAQSISVINRDLMDMIGAASTAEALRYSAGVSINGYGADSRVDEISVRGFRTGSFANNLYLDGLRPPGSSSGASASATQFDGYGLERVEVLRGPSSVLYGQIAPGGLVNVTSKRPTDYSRGELGVGTDNDGLARLNADVSGPLNESGAWLYRLVGTAYHTGTQVDHVNLNRTMFAPSLTWRPSARTSLTLLANYQQDRGGSTYQFLPAHGTYYATRYGRFDSARFLGEPGFNRYDRAQFTIGYLFSRALSDRIKLNQGLRYMRVDTDNTGVSRRGDLLADGRTLQRSASINQIRAEGFTLDNNAEIGFGLGETDHTVLAGLDYRTQTIRVRQASGTAAFLNVFDPVYGGPVTIASPVVPSRRSDSDQTGLYAQDQIRWRQWTATVGLRHDWSHDNARVRATGKHSRYADRATTWHAGLVYLFDNGLAPYASYATSFEPVNGADYGGEPFRPTQGKQAEAGLKYQPPGSRSLVTLSAYEIRQRNITTPDPDPTHLCEGRHCQVQTGAGRVRGLELEGNLALSDRLTLVASATLMSGKVTQSNSGTRGNALPRVPRHSFNAWFDYRFGQAFLPGFSMGLGMRHIGGSYGDSANQYRAAALTLLDAALRYDLARLTPALEGMKFSLNAANLADKRYLASCSGAASCYYGARRSISARLNYAW